MPRSSKSKSRSKSRSSKSKTKSKSKATSKKSTRAEGGAPALFNKLSMGLASLKAKATDKFDSAIGHTVYEKENLDATTAELRKALTLLASKYRNPCTGGKGGLPIVATTDLVKMASAYNDHIAKQNLEVADVMYRHLRNLRLSFMLQAQSERVQLARYISKYKNARLNNVMPYPLTLAADRLSTVMKITGKFDQSPEPKKPTDEPLPSLLMNLMGMNLITHGPQQNMPIEKLEASYAQMRGLYEQWFQRISAENPDQKLEHRAQQQQEQQQTNPLALQ